MISAATAGFTSWRCREQPDLIPVPGRPPYLLRRTHFHYSVLDGVEYEWAIPAGTEVDGVSAPQFLWTVAGIVPDGLMRAAALPHDLHYGAAGRCPLFPVQVTRREADEMFFDDCLRAGVRESQARAAAVALETFGALHWGDKSQRPTFAPRPPEKRRRRHKR